MSQSPDPDQDWHPPAPEASGDAEAAPGGSVRYDAPTTHPGPSTDRYGQTLDPYGQAYGTPAPPVGPPAPASTIVLLVLSALITLTAVGFLWAAPLVLAIVALVKNSADPAGARRLARIGWWVAGALAVLTVLLVVLAVVAVVVFGTGVPSTGYDSSTVGLSVALHHAAAAAR